MINFNDLKARALLVYNETRKRMNTAQRIGGLFSDMLDYIKESLDTKASKEDVANATTNNKGIFSTLSALQAAYPNASNMAGFFAFVGTANPRKKYRVNADRGGWVDTGELHNVADVDLDILAPKVNEDGDQVVYAPDGVIEIPLTDEITSETTTAPTNYAVKEFEKKVLGVPAILGSAIPYVQGNDSVAATATYCYFYENQATIQGQTVLQLEFEIVREGTLSLMRISPNGVDFSFSVIQILNLPLGYQKVDVNIKLGVNEYLGFYNVGDTAKTSRKTNTPNAVGGNIKYYNSTTKTWLTLVSDLCIGVYIKYENSLTINNVVRQANKAITDKGVISVNNLYFVAEIETNGFSNLNIQTFPTGGGFGGAFYNDKGIYISGYTFKTGETAQSERRDIAIPANAKTLKFCFGQDDVLEPLGIPKFDYIYLSNGVEGVSLLERVEVLEKQTTTNQQASAISVPTQINKMNNIIFTAVNSQIQSINSDIEISLSNSVYEDNIYLNGDLSQNFDIAFNFEAENRYESNTSIAFILEKSDGTLFSLSRLGQFKLLVKNDANTLTNNVAFESPIRIKKQGNELVVNISDKEFSLSNIEVKNAYFKIKGNNLINRYFIRNLVNNTQSHSFEISGLMYPSLASCRKNEYIFVAYWMPNKSLAVSKINLITKDIATKEFNTIKAGNDSHNYWAISVDTVNGVHVMGNCHGSKLYYLYGADCMDLETIAISDKLSDTKATYPDFMRNSNLFFATYRNGGSGNSLNYAYLFDSVAKTFTKTTNSPFADGTGGKGGTAYFGKWIELNGWFYNAWCWRTTGDVSTNNQINLIKTQDFVSFYSSKGDKLVLPITRSNNPSYCIDNVLENSGLVNQWFIIPFVFNNAVHVWYMKNDENGNNNIYLVYPDNDGYKTIKITNFNYKWSLYGVGTIDISTIQVTPIDNGDYLVMHIKHMFCGNKSYYIDKNYSVNSDEYQLKEALAESDRYVSVSPIDNILVLSHTDRAYHDRMDALRNGIIKIC